MKKVFSILLVLVAILVGISISTSKAEMYDGVYPNGDSFTISSSVSGEPIPVIYYNNQDHTGSLVFLDSRGNPVSYFFDSRGNISSVPYNNYIYEYKYFWGKFSGDCLDLYASYGGQDWVFLMKFCY